MDNNYTLENLVGDTPVSVQINAALEAHKHEEYALREEIEDLKHKIDMLMSLVGDVPVSEQICAAIAINN